MKPRSYSEKSPTFLRKCPTFFGKSPTFLGKSPTFLGSKCRAKGGIARSIRGENGRLRGGGNPPFSDFQSAQNSGDVRFMLKYVRKEAANCWQLGCYKEICEGCESKKHKTPVGRAHAYAREKAN